MESKTSINILNNFYCVACFLSLSYLITPSSSEITTTRNITAIFGFGNSEMDTGNNNYLPLNIHSDHPPYGKDFPSHTPTGRYSNGKLAIDLIIASLGIKEILPPYLNPTLTDTDLKTGVSFGSAATGLDPLTAQADNVLSISDQINLFDQALTRIQRSVGEESGKFIVENALFFFSFGTDDLINYYTAGQRANEFNISGYQDFLLQIYQDAIRNLYNRGARRFVVNSLSPIGCLPVYITFHNITNPRRCIEEWNIDAIAYNLRLRRLTKRLETQLPDSKIAYYDLYAPMLDMITNPAKYGYEQTLKGCCGTGLFEFGPTCNQSIPTCPDASK